MEKGISKSWDEMDAQRADIYKTLVKGTLEPQVRAAVNILKSIGIPTGSSGFVGKGGMIAKKSPWPCHSIDGLLGLTQKEIEAITTSDTKIISLDEFIPGYQAIIVKGDNNLSIVKARFDRVASILKGIRSIKPQVPHEPVKGEQAGMLGVPGKYIEQKRPWTPGQIGIESYVKYKEAMGKPKTVTPKIRGILETAPFKLSGNETRYVLREGGIVYRIDNSGVVEAIARYVNGKWLAGLTDIPFNKLNIGIPENIALLNSKLAEINKAIPKAEAKVEVEAMKQAEKPSENLYWYSIAELKKMCQDRRLSTEGTKESLIRRLR